VCQSEGLLKLTGSHIHRKSGNISETVLVNNRPLTESDSHIYITNVIAATIMTLFKCDMHICGMSRGPSASAELLIDTGTKVDSFLWSTL